MLISIILIVFVYQIIIFQFESTASNADTNRLSTGTTMDDQNIIQNDDFIKSNIISFDNISNDASTSFDNKVENSEIRSIMYSPTTSAIEPSFITPYPNPPTTFQFSSSLNPLFPNILNFNNSSSDIENDLKTKGKDGSHSSFNATNNHFIAKETRPTFANNINNNSANTSNNISEKTSVQLNPLVDDDINAEDSPENLNLFLQQEEEGIDVNTVITNVVDGNGKVVPFDGYIYSSNITFEFLGLKNGVETDEVDGFECRLDEEDFEECESGMSYSVSPVPHRFEVRSYSYVGESFNKIHDPTPATWKWPIVVETTLEAEDGDDDDIMNRDSTTSNDIEFTFSGEASNVDDEEINERGFFCTLDLEAVVDCGSPLTGVNPFTGNEEFNNLSPGDHIFEVAAFIVVNKGEGEKVVIKDDSPEIIRWTILEDNNGGNNGDGNNGDGNNGDGNNGDGNNGDGNNGDGNNGDGNNGDGNNGGGNNGDGNNGDGNNGDGNNGDGNNGDGNNGDGNNGGGNNGGGNNGGAGNGGNNNPSSTGGPSQVPNEAGGTPDSITPSGNGPTGASPFSPITPVAIDPSIPRDITIYVQQYQNPGPISAKYGTQVGNQCLLQLDRDLLLNPENMSQIRESNTQPRKYVQNFLQR